MATNLTNLIDVSLLKKFYNLTEAQVAAAINAALASALKPGGSKASVAELPALSEANVGFVYNMTAGFTTTAEFIEGAGVEYGAGTNVAIVNNGTNEEPVYKYDVYGNFVDLSGYVEKETGKGLSTNDYDDTEKAKVAGAVQSVATGGADGTVSVDGSDVAVKGFADLANDVDDLKTNAVSVSLATEKQIEDIFKTTATE